MFAEAHGCMDEFERKCMVFGFFFYTLIRVKRLQNAYIMKFYMEIFVSQAFAPTASYIFKFRNNSIN